MMCSFLNSLSGRKMLLSPLRLCLNTGFILVEILKIHPKTCEDESEYFTLKHLSGKVSEVGLCLNES